MHVGVVGMSEVIFECCSSGAIHLGSFDWDLKLANQTRPASLRAPAVSLSRVLELQVHTTALDFSHGPWGSNIGPYACKTSIHQ